ncbi:hypothetical protein RSSM_04473 [Rhodopirellula sallentina SM41]|uniref:Uncharacterized protein n=1 Tax=Rhodopirellula sallentina SM41 TaxID=1263870 RepID=M5UDN0_9BACT|nr:hypothetical protein RSSM_04473 [Rhodopirellula sallentina SM41]
MIANGVRLHSPSFHLQSSKTLLDEIDGGFFDARAAIRLEFPKQMAEGLH